MAMASPSTSTAVPATTSEMIAHSGGIDALRLKVGPVRRNLFGPVDHEQLQQDFQRLFRMNVEVANKRWNFDFERDRPAQGSTVEWEELSCQDVPAFYRSCTVSPAIQTGIGMAKPPRWLLSSSDEGSPLSTSSSCSGDDYLEVSTGGRYWLRQPRKREQPAITDFFKVKKRRRLHYKESSRQ
ncbi:cyclin-dependent kinase inhibitor 1D [Thalassophryne amazonica]|uniref:cyclin-dependent kinase inhibitor 1D n=1 Tax=Thalassophryne amazonica TaxID=390379 RepID=UPI001471C846|nr:cyclin-dependent kinase inhibitor 1D [Thalassophryne amazonica]